MMTSRERFHATFRYGSPDRVFLMPQWMFGATHARWKGEGMPVDVDFASHFGFDRVDSVPIAMGVYPTPERKVIETGDRWEIVEDEFGGRLKQWTDRELGMPQWLQYPVRDRETWNRYKERLNPDTPDRYPENWKDVVRGYKDRDCPIGIQAGSFYGGLRDWVGMEHLALWYYDCPDLVTEMTEYLTNSVLKTIERALNDIPDIDYAHIWEDMAMKTGPLISPKLFREHMMEPLMRTTDMLGDYGIDITLVDCDGCIDELIPLWLEANVNLMFPLEVAAGCDAVRYREQYGRDLLMIGNIDKRVLRDGNTRKDIEDEVMSKVPQLVADGGYSPMVDHQVPPDVPFENFKYYMELIDDVCRQE
jgi:hypothetical protein